MDTDRQPPLLTAITLEGFLSFAHAPSGLREMPLEALNVIIGPNGSGKSNLIEAISLLRAVPQDLASPIRSSGGVMEWLFKGHEGDASGSRGTARIEVVFGGGHIVRSGDGPRVARYHLVFGEEGGRFSLLDERLENAVLATGETEPFTYFGYKNGRPVLNIDADHREIDRLQAEVRELASALESALRDLESDSSYGVETTSRRDLEDDHRALTRLRHEFSDREEKLYRALDRRHRELDDASIDRAQSIVSQLKGPDVYPELTRLGEQLGRIRIYRDWQFGPKAGARSACGIDVRTDYLSEGLDNLPARLLTLKRNPAVKRRLAELLQELAPSFTDFEVVPEGGVLSLYLIEGDVSISARRLSDGTLRYLCLLAILVDPEPPPLICIEEPELGLHPDIQPKLAELLVEASSRTQLIVTTHSDVLVDALSDSPEVVMVCEKQGEATQLRRLDPEKLRPWLERYRLGDLWTRGEIGGTRW